MIHPNGFYFILLICCWVVAASFMAEKTNVGVAVFVAGNTYVCGFRSDGAAALLSACSTVRCCSHQFVFPCLEVLLQDTPPPVRSAARLSQDIVWMSTAFLSLAQTSLYRR